MQFPFMIKQISLDCKRLHVTYQQIDKWLCNTEYKSSIESSMWMLEFTAELILKMAARINLLSKFKMSLIPLNVKLFSVTNTSQGHD